MNHCSTAGSAFLAKRSNAAAAAAMTRKKHRWSDRAVKPGWVKKMLDQARTRGFLECKCHDNGQTRGNMKRFFCVECCTLECQYCTDAGHTSHVVIQLSKTGASTISVKAEPLELLLNMSDVWPYNGGLTYQLEGKTLKPGRRMHTVDAGVPGGGACLACNRKPNQRDGRYYFCSLLCKHEGIYEGFAPVGTTFLLQSDGNLPRPTELQWKNRKATSRISGAAAAPASTSFEAFKESGVEDDDHGDEIEMDHHEDGDSRSEENLPLEVEDFDIEDLDIEGLYIVGVWGKPLTFN